MSLKFQGGLVPGNHNVQGLESRNGSLALRSSVSMFLKMMTSSRVKKRTELIVNKSGSSAKYLIRHGKWTEAQTPEQRAGVLSP